MLSSAGSQLVTASIRVCRSLAREVEPGAEARREGRPSNSTARERPEPPASSTVTNSGQLGKSRRSWGSQRRRCPPEIPPIRAPSPTCQVSNGFPCLCHSPPCANSADSSPGRLGPQCCLALGHLVRTRTPDVCPPPRLHILAGIKTSMCSGGHEPEGHTPTVSNLENTSQRAKPSCPAGTCKGPKPTCSMSFRTLFKLWGRPLPGDSGEA